MSGPTGVPTGAPRGVPADVARGGPGWGPPSRTTPGRPVRRRRGSRLATLLLVLVTAVVTTVLVLRVVQCPAFAPPLPQAYVPATDRNAVHVGGDSYSSTEIEKISTNIGYMVIPKFADGFDLQQQFADARQIVAAAKDKGNPIKVMAYFSSSYWFSKNDDGWKPYSTGFQDAWYLHDSTGQPVTFSGVGATANKRSKPVGYMVDLSNPAYRAWAISTLTQWMKAAPFGGVNFDSSRPLVGTDQRHGIGDGTSNWNDLLCGSGASTGSDGNCAKVDAWNAGLDSLLRSASAALHPLGGTVIYNGVAPVPSSSVPDRNQGLLAYADMADNESFCLTQKASDPDQVTFSDLHSDLTMMQQQAANGKKLTEITNYGTDAKRSYGPYCLGAFLMGWQPGSSYWAFQQGYHDEMTDFPAVAEQNLSLGRPSSRDYTTDGSVLSRSFEHGFVAVNTGSGDARVTVPVAAERFQDGEPVGKVAAGESVSVSGHDGVFFLSQAFLSTIGASSHAVSCQ